MTTQKTDETNRKTQYPRLEVMADPDNAGLHPYHDSRWIVTEGTQIERGHDERPGNWGVARHSESFLVAQMRDVDPRMTAEIVRRFNSAPALVEAFSDILDDSLEFGDSYSSECLQRKIRAALRSAGIDG